MWSGTWLWFGFISLMGNETEYLFMYSLANFKKCLLKYFPIFKLYYLFFFFFTIRFLIVCYVIFIYFLLFFWSSISCLFPVLLALCCLSDALWGTVFYFWCGPICFVYLLLAVLGLHCCAGFFSSCGTQGLLKAAALAVVPPLVAEHRL